MPDLNKCTKVTSCWKNGDLTEMTPSDVGMVIVDATPENGVLFGAKGRVLTIGGETPLAIVVTDVLDSSIPYTGLYVVCDPAMMWISEVVFEGELHTIDPKYLPIKEINLDNYGDLSAHIAALIGDGGGSYTVPSVGNLWSDVVSDSLVYVKFGIPQLANVAVMGATVLHPINSEHPTQLSFSAAVDFKDNTGVPLNVFVIINYTPSTTELTVKVTPLGGGSSINLPNAEEASF
jgi:hypothetical protein